MYFNLVSNIQLILLLFACAVGLGMSEVWFSAFMTLFGVGFITDYTINQYKDDKKVRIKLKETK